MIDLAAIRSAQERIEEHVYRSPCAYSETFSQRCGASVHFKLENLQMTGSFKERGATNKILQLDDEAKSRGVIAASAGNHAQAVAYIAQKTGIAATIVMPRRTPLVKIANTRRHGAKIVLEGDTFDDAVAVAAQRQASEGSIFIHPFDDDDIVAGQGTLGLELADQLPDLDIVIVPVGGGGLISGTACALAELNPRTRVIGVQTKAVPSMSRSLAEGRPVLCDSGRTIADGIAVKRPGERTLAYVEKWVDDLVTVDEEEIANAVLLLLEEEKTVAEGAGACALAALCNGHVPQAVGKTTAVVVSGGNIDVNLLSRIIDKGLAKDGRLVRLELGIEDSPGALAGLLLAVGEQRANVVEVHHNRAFNDLGLARVEVELTLETRGAQHAGEVREGLEKAGYQPR